MNVKTLDVWDEENSAVEYPRDLTKVIPGPLLREPDSLIFQLLESMKLEAPRTVLMYECLCVILDYSLHQTSGKRITQLVKWLINKMNRFTDEILPVRSGLKIVALDRND